MNLVSYYWPLAPWIWVYMLQQVEYDSRKFLAWSKKMPNMLRIQKRQQLDLTPRATITLVIAYGIWVSMFVSGLVLLFARQYILGIAVLLTIPLMSVCAIALFNRIFASVIVKPKESQEIKNASNKLAATKNTKIAVLGSYGKTTMKDILLQVLSGGMKIAATPGNKNVLISHARWVLTLEGDEQALIFEYGEAKPGDIRRLADFSHPDYAVITGLAPAHLEDYGSLDAVGDDFKTIFTVAKKVFINSESPELIGRIKDGLAYSQVSVDGWLISDVKIDIQGVSFTMKKDNRKLDLKSGLLGVHNIGPLAAVAALAIDLGLDDQQITDGIANTKPFEHRMQPYQLGGAWIIDDTYNGNIEGIKAGLALLEALPAKRKVYVTPGLVEQGEEKERVHLQMGQLIAQAKLDMVVLMKNSATNYIMEGLKQIGFAGEIKIEEDPLSFYKNLEHIVAHGDLVLMQNDWTDNYN